MPTEWIVSSMFMNRPGSPRREVQIKHLASPYMNLGMKFEFRSQMQSSAGPTHKPALGFRAGAMHTSSIAEAAERFMREQLSRKRTRTFSQ